MCVVPFFYFTFLNCICCLLAANMTLVCAECQIQFNNWSKASHHQHLTSLLEEITAEMMTNRCPVTAEQALSFWIKITSEGNKKSAEHRSFYRYIPLWYDKNLLLTFKLELNYYLTDYLVTKMTAFSPPNFKAWLCCDSFFFPSTVFPYSFCKSSGVLMNIISSGSSAT